MSKAGNTLRYGALAVLVLIIIVIGVYLGRALASKDYPKLQTSDLLQDTVKEVSGARVTFSSGRQFTLPSATTTDEGKEVSLTQIVSVGDVLIKEEGSDAIILVKGEKRYTFE